MNGQKVIFSHPMCQILVSNLIETQVANDYVILDFLDHTSAELIWVYRLGRQV